MISRRALETIVAAIVSLAAFQVLIVLVYLDFDQRSRISIRDLPTGIESFSLTTDTFRKLELEVYENDVVHNVIERKEEDESNIIQEHLGDVLQESMLKRQIDQGANICQGTKTALAITFINSRPENTALRKAIRTTWGKDGKRKRIVTLFILGKGATLGKDKSVFKENKEHGDLLQGTFSDKFRTTSLKMFMALKWMEMFCPQVKFIFMVDDVNFVNYNLLFKIFENTKENNAILLGNVIKNRAPVRQSKSQYYISLEQYESDVFPPFCTSESGFVLSMSAAKSILEAASTTALIPIGDIFIAVLAERSNVTVTDDKRFTFRNLNHDTCLFRNIITARGFDASSTTAKLWANLSDPEFLKSCQTPGDVDSVMQMNVSNVATFDKLSRLLVDSPDLCKDFNNVPDDIFMVVLISTRPIHVGNRDMIRKTWGRSQEVMGMGIRLLFVMGRPANTDDDTKYQSIIKNEQIKYGDVIQADFIENFHNLTLKVILGLKWVTDNCPNAEYMYKGDDDMFVNFENIISYILNLRAKGEALQKFYVGSVLRRSVIVRTPKSRYYVPIKMYSGTYFPPYCSGGGYVFSTDVIHAMYLKALTVHLIPIDDAFQGILAEEVGVIPTHHDGFKNWGGPTDRCALKKGMTVHGVKTPVALYKVWGNFTDTSIRC